MSAENEKTKPKTHDEIFQNNNTNTCGFWKILKNDSGAGANAAASRLDMTLAATDPLSEIVWSPDKGLSLKCADSSFADKNSCSLYRDVGPSCAVIAPPQGGRCTTDNISVETIAAVCAETSNIAARDAPTVHPTSDSGAKLEYKAYEENDLDRIDQNPIDNSLLQSDEPKPSMEQSPSPGRPSNEGIVDISLGKRVVVADDDLCNTIEPLIECKGSGAPGTNLTSSGKSPLEKTESSAENDLRTIICDAGTSGAIADETENKVQDNEMMLQCDEIRPDSHSPCNSRILMKIKKGKEKSLSDGDLRLSEENDSQSSVESCNSAGGFSTGRKRRNFQQQLIVGSKRVKKQIEGTSGSKSHFKQDSSFMNWISNMVKGLSQSIHDDSDTLTHTLANPNHRNLKPEEKILTCNVNQDPEPKNTGFKSIFQSIYCPRLKNVGTRMSHQGEANEDLQPHGIDATPITCCVENNSLSKQCSQSNKFEVSSGGYDAGPSSQPKIKPLNFFNNQESSKSNPLEDKSGLVLGLGKDKEGLESHTSSTRQNTNNTENVDSNALSERKEAENICHRRDNLTSLWITRFSTKTVSGHLIDRAGSQVHSSGLLKLPDSHKDTEASTGLKEDNSNKDHASKQKFNFLSSGFRNLEPMASIFARRFGAIKHIIPTDRTDNLQNMFCWFCGTKGHELSDCSAVAESELEYLQKNMNSYGGLENLSCLCIKCFQTDHWATSCPTSSSTRKHDFQVNALVNDCIPSDEHFITKNEGSVRLLTGEDGRVLSVSSIDDGIEHQADQNMNLKRKSSEIGTLRIGGNASFKKYCHSSSGEDKFKENPTSSPFKFAERQISHVPKGIFDAVRRLRLSRTDILKWTIAEGSISELDGFFLRIRLGKWEEGLGGTGYHVAYINETQRQSSEQNSRKSLSVKVGGIKCMVESQYISNHDFLEEEVMEWLSTTSEARAAIPSEEDVIEKLKKRKMLGL